MTPLLGTALGVVLAVLTALVAFVLAALAVLLVLVSLLVLDRLLERYGVDRRRALRSGWRRVRGPRTTAGTTSTAPAPAAERTTSPRTPFSTRLADRVAAGRRPQAEPETAAPEVREPEPRTPATGTPATQPPAAARPTAAVPVPDAPTEVLPVPRAEEPDDRDSAIQRLFAPLLDDRTEPLGTTPPPSRPSRRRSGDEQ